MRSLRGGPAARFGRTLSARRGDVGVVQSEHVGEYPELVGVGSTRGHHVRGTAAIVGVMRCLDLGPGCLRVRHLAVPRYPCVDSARHASTIPVRWRLLSANGGHEPAEQEVDCT